MLWRIPPAYCCNIDFSDRLSGPLTCISGLVSMRESRLALNLNIRYPVSTDGAFLLRCVRTACAPHGFSMALLNHNKPLYLPATTRRPAPAAPRMSLEAVPMPDTCRTVLRSAASSRGMPPPMAPVGAAFISLTSASRLTICFCL